MADKAAAAAQLAALHSQLAVLLPDLLRLEELLRSCLASHSAGTSELAPLLQQRLQQCGAAVTLLRGLPAGAAGREEEGVQALAAAKPFIESSAAMIQDVQNLIVVLAGPDALEEVASMGTTERTWLQHGIQLQRPSPRLPAGTEQQQAAQQGQQQPVMVPMPMPAGQQQQQQQQHVWPPPQVPQGMSLLQQQPQAQPGQPAMPLPPLAPWSGAGPSTGAPSDMPFTTSFDMLPVLPSVGALPSLSQLLEEPMMTLSLQDNEWVAQAAAAAIAAVQGKAGGAAAGAQQQQQQQPGELQKGGPQPSLALIENLLNPWGAAGPPQLARQQQVAQPPVVSVPTRAAAAQMRAAALPAGKQQAAAAAGAPATAQLSPVSSGELPQTSGGSGSLLYRRVSFAPLHAMGRASIEESMTSSSSNPSAAVPGLPFGPRPSAAPSSTGSLYLARTSSGLGTAGDPAASGAHAGGGATAARVALVQPAAGALRISISDAAPAPAAQPAAGGGKERQAQFTTAGTADGPVMYVSVHEAPAHEFSQGETSLSRLFYEAKLTGVLPVPEAVAEGSHEGAGGGSSACQGGRSRASSQEGSGPGSGASCADSGGAGGTPALAENVRQTRAAARRSGHAGGGAAGSLPPPPPQQQQEIAGTKRRKAGGGS